MGADVDWEVIIESYFGFPSDSHNIGCLVGWLIYDLDSVTSEVSFIDYIFITEEDGEVGDEVDWEVIVECYFSFLFDSNHIGC